MVKATITFDALDDLVSYLRSQLKYEELDEKEYAFTEKSQSKIIELLEQHNVNVDELVR